MELELIHADAQRHELEQVLAYTRFDAETGTESDADNDWMLELPEEVWQDSPILNGHYIYCPGTEWGGPVERVEHLGGESSVRVYGVCWRGLLGRTVICPPEGATHLAVQSADANTVLSALLDGWQSGIFSVSEDVSGVVCAGNIRYKTLLEAMAQLLGDSGRLSIEYSGGMVHLECLPVRDRSDEIELSQDYDAKITSDSRAAKYDHIIALGGGELLERTVIELWRLPNGTITDDPEASGIVAAALSHTLLYDYSAVESDDKLRRSAIEKLRENAAADSMEIELYDYGSGLELTDIASVRDSVTGMTAELSVVERRVKSVPDGLSFEYRLA